MKYSDSEQKTRNSFFFKYIHASSIFISAWIGSTVIS